MLGITISGSYITWKAALKSNHKKTEGGGGIEKGNKEKITEWRKRRAFLLICRCELTNNEIAVTTEKQANKKLYLRKSEFIGVFCHGQFQGR